MDVPRTEFLKRKLLALLATEPEAQRELELMLADWEGDAESEMTRLLGLLAPLVRRVRLEDAQPDRCLAGISVSALREWFAWLDEMDPDAARMLDLRYFARLGIADIAAILRTSREAIRRELLRQRGMIRIRLED